MRPEEPSDVPQREAARRGALDATLDGDGQGHSLNDVDALPRGATLGRYVILEKVGSGAFGVVYAAYDFGLDRKVALKLLQADAGSDARLLEEAKALARLAHPNIVTVHDVGTFRDRVFLAMEFVDGQTLTDWSETERPLAEILDVMGQAGRGLAAAHAAEMIHRDFKPDNVMIGSDGRVRVTDFGLAKPLAGAEPDGAGAGEPGSPDRSMATTGSGTPAYMAPERFRGSPAAASSDQFSFCVALYEALHGVPPFDGKSIQELAVNVVRGRLTGRKGRNVPPWVQKVALRGLRPEPADRYPAMEDLLRDLAGPPRARRQRILAIAAGALVLGGGAVGYGLVRQDAAPVCRGGGEKLAPVWNPTRRQALQAAFLATKAPFAPDTWRTVDRGLDEYTRGWSTMYADACEATRVRQDQSEALLDLRMQCLDRRLEELEALASVFEKADAQVVGRAAQALDRLSSWRECSRPEVQRGQVRPPPEALRPRLAAIEKKVATAKSLVATGRTRPGADLATEAVSLARDTHYLPVQADALLVLAQSRGELNDFRGQVDATLQAFEAATIAGSDKVAATAAIKLGYVLGIFEGKLDEAQRWGHVASATIGRMGGDPQLEVMLGLTQGPVLSESGDDTAAIAQLRAALAKQQTLDPDSYRIADLSESLAIVLEGTGQYSEARSLYERALALRERRQGKNAAYVGTLINLAHICSQEGKDGQALPYLQRAFAIQERLGKDSRRWLDLLRNLATAYLGLDRYDDALPAIKQAVELDEKDGNAHFLFLDYMILGNVLQGRGQYDLAGEAYGRGLAKAGPDENTAELFADLGSLAARRRRYDEAIAYQRRGLATATRLTGGRSGDVAIAEARLGQIYLEAGKLAQAIEVLEHALSLFADFPRTPLRQAEARFALARALEQTGGDRARAVRLAREARDIYGQREDERKGSIAEIDRWLARQAR